MIPQIPRGEFPGKCALFLVVVRWRLKRHCMLGLRIADLIRTYDNFSQFRPTRTKSMHNVCNVARTESGFATLPASLAKEREEGAASLDQSTRENLDGAGSTLQRRMCEKSRIRTNRQGGRNPERVRDVTYGARRGFVLGFESRVRSRVEFGVFRKIGFGVPPRGFVSRYVGGGDVGSSSLGAVMS